MTNGASALKIEIEWGVLEEYWGEAMEDDRERAEARKAKEAELVEKLAELEHEQWIEWSKELQRTEKLSMRRLIRWINVWMLPYNDLPKELKEENRKWARRVLAVLKAEVHPVRTQRKTLMKLEDPNPDDE